MRKKIDKALDYLCRNGYVSSKRDINTKLFYITNKEFYYNNEKRIRRLKKEYLYKSEKEIYDLIKLANVQDLKVTVNTLKKHCKLSHIRIYQIVTSLYERNFINRCKFTDVKEYYYYIGSNNIVPMND